MTGRGGRVPLSPEASDKAYAEYVAAVGEVAFHWNALLEALGLVFVQVVGTPRSVGLGIWYSLQSDRAQMDILTGALRGRESEDSSWTKRDRAAGDIAWVVKEVKSSLSGQRNDAIHAPAELTAPVFARSDGTLAFVGDLEIGPSFFHGHPRATTLKGKALVDEFRWYAARAKCLADFTKKIEAALWVEGEPWPKRPTLPSPGQ